ncbi:MAG: 4-hydroxy-tetrahydrodipicolinate synthase [Bacteroidales bacterium]|jgi:4-hydroxy-tetrahydrodipicolinate synthase|nr:4-hydroxy-tetrahydrodipicolinate synthase [Bacteroidales bacterium]MBQ6082611.1 4-hydroxy-tetrahydrodipicolinate synthase [Bacteroidales bacterium]MBQ9529281.1 4-hydroxy-tetrahydrodipicolinate synthase [Bacteroidales bacterium]
MNNLKLQGCGTALITPFKNEEVDYKAFENLVKSQIEAGIHFLVPLGTTGETPCLLDQERIKLLQIAKEHAAGRPVMVGVGTNSIVMTRNNIEVLTPYDPDAFLVVTPYYNKPSQDGLFSYFTAVADFAPRPVVLYNVPGRTGVNISADTTLRLAEHPNIIAVKEASGNYDQISKIIAHAPEGFAVLSGNDDETLSLMATGAAGVISVASNIVPREMVAMTEAMLRGDLAAARPIHHRLFDLFKNCFVESNPIPAKAALYLMGMIQNELRLPLVPAQESTMQLMEKTLKDLNLI